MATSSSSLHSVKLTNSEQIFFQRLKQCSEQVQQYEDELLQALARSVIPLETLQKHAVEKSGCEITDPKTNDFLLLELLRWFKHEFFTWTDSPKCLKCNGTTKYHAHLEPTSEEWSDDAHRVEGHKCDVCELVTRFPRYNNPGKLLETRTGRCGEWANCFTLCARAIGFEARYVIDWSDHVWTEVYSAYQKRWLHCDSCENACDTPLMYEEGWGKKLTYVIAFDKDEIVDVTYRYSKNHKELTSRRTECRELVLQDYINAYNAAKREKLPVERRRELEKRFCCELVEYLFPRLNVKSNETQGRSSGSLDWRIGRGETTTTKFESVTIVPTAAEIEAGEISLTYFSYDDLYVRKLENLKTNGWTSYVYDFTNIFRKVEYDWKKVYLCRSEGSVDDGRLVFMFKCPDEAKIVFDSAVVEIHSQTFENGRIRATLCADDSCNGSGELHDLSGCKSFKIEIVVTGGQGNNAWQHSQLFRTDFESHEPSLSVKISLKKL